MSCREVIVVCLHAELLDEALHRLVGIRVEERQSVVIAVESLALVDVILKRIFGDAVRLCPECARACVARLGIIAELALSPD